MKWSIVILLVLGLVAAVCAAVLMGTLQLGQLGSSASGKQPQSLEVAMANASLPSMTVMKLEDINVEVVSRDELPGGKLVNPKQIIGRVLAIPVVEGQVLTETCFVERGSAQDIIAHIPKGWRAVTIHVSNSGMPDRALLLPGSIVDVLVSYSLSSRNDQGEALSTTMLRGVQVLAISGDVVASNTEDEEEKENKKRTAKQSGSLVTLLVDTKQAEALQLAKKNGDIMLSIRNPGDKQEFDEDPSILNKDKLTPRGSDLPPSIKNQANVTVEGLDQAGQTPGSNNSQQMGSESVNDGTKTLKPDNKYNDSRNPLREVEVIRGAKKEKEEIQSTEEGEADKTDPKN